MKRILTVFILFSFWSSHSVMTQEPDFPDGFILSPLMRSTHFVRDIDESVKLYGAILGLKPRVERTAGGKEWDQILGVENKTVRVMILQSGEYVFANVGLFQFVGEKQPPRPVSRTSVETGDAALVFLTSDIFGINEKVKAAGYAIVSEPIVLFPKEGSDTQSYEMLFFDHDGILVNLIQRNVPSSQVPSSD